MKLLSRYFFLVSFHRTFWIDRISRSVLDMLRICLSWDSCRRRGRLNGRERLARMDHNMCL
ncbi:hypothetical protein OIU74_008779 [Salix koriyanagi]|uniref:Uncharacterized protein n=1 Tax=Salix koriyanagi TaxID=2511006 RepID=A0A9Q0Z015_9ROSI|nr:hypothetical protein OIU74_008779 [Salix koriyanagi]